MEEVQRTYIDSNSNPWGGSAWGAGIGYQNTCDKLAEKAAEVEALKGQLFSTNAMAAQTAAIISALKPTTAG